MEARTNALDLVVNNVAVSSAFFVYRADTLQALAAMPALAIQTNTPLTNNIRFPLPAPAASLSQVFFKAIHWPGRSVDQFCGTNGVTPVPNMVCIPAGTFTMGSPNTEPARFPNEGPQTHVTISHGFRMGKYEVTQGEYASVMANNRSWFNGPRPSSYGQDGGGPIDYGANVTRPVETVSWNDAVAYCASLTTQERSAGRLTSGYVYRLPTEAEWEYACRAATTTAFHYGNALRSGMANFDGHYEYPPCVGPDWCYNGSGIFLGRTTPGGSYAPNAWGLYDMHGNVSNWLQDSGVWAYPGGSVTDPTGPSSGGIRGGAWDYSANYCRSAIRGDNNPNRGYFNIGFRVVLAPVQP